MTENTSATATAGTLLRAARERQGLHIAALAAAIKVTPRKLDALENDRWNELPDATFTRALAQTVCRSLKIDAKPVLDLLPPAEPVALEPSAPALNEPFTERPGREDSGWVAAAIRPMVVAAGVLMLAAVAIYFVPESWWSAGRSGPTPTPVVTLPVPGTPAQTAVQPVAAPSTADAASAPALAVSGVVSQADTAAPRGETVFAAPPASAASAAVVSGLVQMRTSDASWVEVRDGSGRVLLSRTVMPGEGVGLDGTAPFRVVIGNAAATELTYRGRAVDLTPHTRDSVARVELK